MDDAGKERAYRWRWIGGVSFSWTLWGVGVELALLHWYPREVGIYIQLGPIMARAGIEQEPIYVDG